MTKQSSKRIKILQVNQTTTHGGAARIAMTLHQAYRAAGYISWLVTNQKDNFDESIVQFPDETYFFMAGMFEKASSFSLKTNIKVGRKSLSHYLYQLMDPWRLFVDFFGLENYNFPASRKLFDWVPDFPDVVHLHNLHRNYFDLSFLPKLSSQRPTLITLHDTWLLSGHCAYSLDCEKWKTGCGQCPYLDSYPPIKYDNTHLNWKRKKKIYSNSRLYIATPSHWILEKANQSILKPAMVEGRVIHNGIDQSIFYPGDKKAARRKLGVPQNTTVLLFVASYGKDNPYKDFDTIWKAIQKIKIRGLNQEILLLVLGQIDGYSEREEQYAEKIRIRYVPYQTNPSDVAEYYRVADIYLQASQADTFPTVVLEALACGIAVVATGVGGIPEQITDGQTGYLVKPGDWMVMAELTIKLIKDEQLRTKMGAQAAEDARKRFQIGRMVSSYIDWYHEILDKNIIQDTHNV